MDDGGHDADHDACHSPADEENGEVVCNLRRPHDQAGHDDLSDIVQDTAHDADRRAGEELRFFEERHADEAERRTHEAVEHTEDRSEQYGGEKHANETHRCRFLKTDLVEHENDDEIRQADLDAGNGNERGDLAFNEGQDHG